MDERYDHRSYEAIFKQLQYQPKTYQASTGLGPMTFAVQRSTNWAIQ